MIFKRLDGLFHFPQLLHFATFSPHHGLGSLCIQIFSFFVSVNQGLELIVVQASVFV